MAERASLEWHSQRFNALLLRLVQQVPAKADRVVLHRATVVLSDIQTGWPVDSGASRAAWYGPQQIGEAAYQLGNPMAYALPIEYGGYPGVGPKTAEQGPETLPGDFEINRGIYPVQVPAAPVRRALARNYGEMTKELQQELRTS